MAGEVSANSLVQAAADDGPGAKKCKCDYDNCMKNFIANAPGSAVTIIPQFHCIDQLIECLKKSGNLSQIWQAAQCFGLSVQILFRCGTKRMAYLGTTNNNFRFRSKMLARARSQITSLLPLCCIIRELEVSGQWYKATKDGSIRNSAANFCRRNSHVQKNSIRSAEARFVLDEIGRQKKTFEEVIASLMGPVPTKRSGDLLPAIEYFGDQDI